MSDEKFLLYVADGPDSIEIYTSVDEAIVDGAEDVPGLYLLASCGMNSQVRLGPFGLSQSLIRQLQEKLKP